MFWRKRNHQQVRNKNKRIYVLAATLPLLLILIPAIYFGLRFATRAQAAWLDDSWKYRAKVPITGHTFPETNVYFSVTINTSDTTRFQSDCGDIRFTDISGKVLQYYIASGCSSASTVIHVLVPSFPGGLSDYYYYYGNPSAPNGFAAADFTAGSSITVGSVGSEEKGTGPVAYWSMNEAVDDSCSGGTNDICDSSTNQLDGAQSNNPIWQTDDRCISGKCLWFNGSNAIDTVTNATPIDLDASGGLSAGFTFEAWIRPNGAGEGTGGQIFFKGTNTWLKVTNLSNNLLDLSASVDLATTDATLTVSAKVTNNRWTHVALSYTDDGDDEITIWVNGVNVGSSTNGVGSLAADTNNLVIGGTTTNNFAGFIDEFKIYNYEKTATQMLSTYNGVGSGDAVSNSNGTTSQKYLSDGLVGYWNMDEASWATNCSTASVLDNSGNGNNGKPCPNASAATLVGGKFGNTGSFDGTNDYLDIPDSTSLDVTSSFTLAAWVNMTSITSGCTSTTGSILNKGRDSTTTYTFTLEQVGTGCDGSGNFAFKLYNGSSNPIIQGTTVASTSTWYHVVGTYDGTAIRIYVNGKLEGTTATTIAISAQTSNVAIGRNSNNADRYFTGKIDEARIYNRALSPAEVRSLYIWAPGPVGYWPFDEASTTIGYDRSAYENNATLNCPSKSTGKFGKSYESYDGCVGTGADTPSSSVYDVLNTGKITLSAWVYYQGRNIFNNDGQIFGHHGCCGDTSYSIRTDGGDSAYLEMSDGTNSYTMTTTIALQTNQWTYITAVIDHADSTKTLLYINGVVAGTTSSGTFGSVGNLGTNKSLNFMDNYYQTLGRIDEVKYYNYARTPSQIYEDMTATSSVGRVSNGSSLIYLPMDEQYGSTVNNTGLGGSTYSGTRSGTTWWTNAACKVNGCLSLDGTTDYISTSLGTMLDSATTFSTSFWLNPTSLATNRMIVSKANTTTQRAFQIKTDTTTSSELRVMISSSASDTSNYCVTSGFGLVTSSWQHITVVYDGSQGTGNDNRVKVYKNGKLVSCVVTGTIPTSLPTTTSSLKLGQGDDTTPTALIGYIDEWKFYLDKLSSDQVLIDYNGSSTTSYGAGTPEASQGVDGAGNVPILYEPFDTPQRTGGGIIGIGNGTPLYWWKFDAGSGTTAADSGSGGTNTGTVQGSAAWGTGISGADIVFDGVNDYVSTTTSVVDPQTFSISVWFKTTVASGHKIVAFEDAQTGTGGSNYDRHIMMDTNGHIEAGWYTGSVQTITSTNALNDGTWHNAVFTKGTNSATLYIDGVSQGTGTGAAQSYTGYWRVGSYAYNSWPNGTQGYFSGEIDEVKIYSTELSAGQVANEVGSYKYADDISGAGLSLSTTNTLTQGFGKFGRSLVLTASDTGLTMADNSTFDFAAASNFTISTYAKHSASVAAVQYLLTKADTTNGGYKLYMDASGHYCFGIDDDSSWTPDDAACSTASYATDGLWHHVVGKKTGTTKIELFVDGRLAGSDSTIAATGTLANTNALYVGSDRDGTSNMWVGEIDDLKMYNYGRTNAQIAYDYNRGAPIGWWQFDDCQSATAKDASGNGNDASLTYGGGTYTAVGTCNTGVSSDAWYGGRTGKINGSIAIDTTTDTISVGNVSMYGFDRTDPFSTSIWIKTTTNGSATIMSKQDSSAPFSGWNVQTGGSGWLYLQLVSTYSSSTLEVHSTGDTNYYDGNWHLITTTYDGSSSPSGVKIYIDAKLVPMTTSVNTLTTAITNSIPMYIGSRNGTAQKFSGQLDDARLYNYVLSVDQIKKIMLGGSSINFGPATGSP